MSGYVLGRDAEQDLNDTWDYIAEDSVETADRPTARLRLGLAALSRTLNRKKQQSLLPASGPKRLNTPPPLPCLCLLEDHVRERFVSRPPIVVMLFLAGDRVRQAWTGGY